MILIATDWLGLALLLAVFAWFAKRRVIGLSLPFAVALAALAVYLPTGSPRFTKPPPAEYTVVGADIQVNIAIYVLLKSGDAPPTYYKFPYTTAAANQLQQAMDGAQGGSGGIKAKVDGEGGVAYDGEPPVQGNAPKTPEVPAIQIP